MVQESLVADPPVSAHLDRLEAQRAYPIVYTPAFDVFDTSDANPTRGPRPGERTFGGMPYSPNYERCVGRL